MSPAMFSSSRNAKKDEDKSWASDVSTAASSRSPASAGSAVIVLPPPDAENDARECIGFPPRIPSRTVTRPAMEEVRQIITSSDDDGSVECSVRSTRSNGSKNQEMLQLTSDGNVVSTKIEEACNSDDVETNSRSAASVVAADSEDGSIEVSVLDDASKCNSQASPKSIADIDNAQATGIAPVPKIKKKSRMELAREKMAKHKPRTISAKDNNAEGGARQQGKPSAYAPTTTESVERAIEAAMSKSQDAGDDKTVTSNSTHDSKMSKKDKLKKIMDYRNKAKKQNLPQRTLDEWLVAKNKANGGVQAEKESEKKSAKARVVSEKRVDLDDLDDMLEEERRQLDDLVAGEERAKQQVGAVSQSGNQSQSSYSAFKSETSKTEGSGSEWSQNGAEASSRYSAMKTHILCIPVQIQAMKW